MNRIKIILQVLCKYYYDVKIVLCTTLKNQQRTIQNQQKNLPLTTYKIGK